MQNSEKFVSEPRITAETPKSAKSVYAIESTSVRNVSQFEMADTRIETTTSSEAFHHYNSLNGVADGRNGFHEQYDAAVSEIATQSTEEVQTTTEDRSDGINQ